MKNEYLVLYAVADMFAYHFLSNDLAKLDRDNNIVFVKNPKEFSKPEKRVYEELMKILRVLNTKLSKEAFYVIKDKYEKILKGFKDSKYFSEYAPILVGLSILSEYTKTQGKKLLSTHPKSVEKILELSKEIAKFKYLDQFVLNSLALGSKFYKEMTK